MWQSDTVKHMSIKTKGGGHGMNRLMKKALVIGTSLVMCVASLTGCGNKINPDDIVATVGDNKITLGTANFFARFQQASYETFYAGMMGTTGEEMWNQIDESGKAYDETVKEGLMDNLTSMYIIRDHAEEYGVSLTDEEKAAIDKTADEFIKANSEEVLNDITASKESVAEVLELMTIQHKMNAPLMAEAKETAEKLKDTEAKEDEESSEAEDQAAIDYQYNEIITAWKKDVKVDVDKDMWSKVDFKKKGFTMKQQED